MRISTRALKQVSRLEAALTVAQVASLRRWRCVCADAGSSHLLAPRVMPRGIRNICGHDVVCLHIHDQVGCLHTYSSACSPTACARRECTSKCLVQESGPLCRALNLCHGVRQVREDSPVAGRTCVHTRSLSGLD